METPITATPITEGQLKQFGRFITDLALQAVQETGLGKKDLQYLASRGNHLKRHMIEGIAAFGHEPRYDLARSILGEDFIPAENIASAFGLSYSKTDLVRLGAYLPDEAALAAIREQGMLLIAGPPRPLSLLDIRELHPGHFYASGRHWNVGRASPMNDYGWFDDHCESFARRDKARPGWLAIQKKPLKASCAKTWEDQQSLVREPLLIPNVAEVAWMCAAYAAMHPRGGMLLTKHAVRTSSLPYHKEGHVTFGDYDKYGSSSASFGYHVSCPIDDWTDSGLGVVLCRKF